MSHEPVSRGVDTLIEQMEHGHGSVKKDDLNDRLLKLGLLGKVTLMLGSRGWYANLEIKTGRAQAELVIRSRFDHAQPEHAVSTLEKSLLITMQSLQEIKQDMPCAE